MPTLTLKRALEAVCIEESPANRETVNVATDVFVDSMKAAGKTVEQIIVELKQMARECRYAPCSERIMADVLQRIVKRYYQRSDPPRETPAPT
ncbi:MAG TPA: hypothetical protein VJ867_10300 [Gemmatimonadaceae bacterium]|nr:hypothetical protein [Gemmatimonadaceae bacterium]